MLSYLCDLALYFHYEILYQNKTEASRSITSVIDSV